MSAPGSREAGAPRTWDLAQRGPAPGGEAASPTADLRASPPLPAHSWSVHPGFPAPPGASPSRATCAVAGAWAGRAAFKADDTSPGQRLAIGCGGARRTSEVVGTSITNTVANTNAAAAGPDSRSVHCRCLGSPSLQQLAPGARSTTCARCVNKRGEGGTREKCGEGKGTIRTKFCFAVLFQPPNTRASLGDWLGLKKKKKNPDKLGRVPETPVARSLHLLAPNQL